MAFILFNDTNIRLSFYPARGSNNPNGVIFRFFFSHTRKNLTVKPLYMMKIKLFVKHFFLHRHEKNVWKYENHSTTFVTLSSENMVFHSHNTPQYSASKSP